MCIATRRPMGRPFHGDKMNINSPKSQRTFMLEVQTATADQYQFGHTPSATTRTIVCIDTAVDDGVAVIEAHLYGAAEKDLLRQFWQLVHPRDVFYGRNVADRLAFLRQRTWKVGLIPSSEVDLRAIYQHNIRDRTGLSLITGDAGYSSAEALLIVLGLLPGKV